MHLMKLINKVSKVKDIWATYFEKYDSVNLSNEKKFEKVNNTFIEWKEIVIKPLNNSEARLFAAETRLKETEDLMIKTFAHNREVMKKLVFALEQENISNRDALLTQMIKRTETNLEGIRSDSRVDSSRPKTSKDKSMDFLFIKRLLYIKHEIDEYPKEKEKKEEVRIVERIKPKTPKSLLESKKITHHSSLYVDHKPRVKTSMNKHRRHEFSSMSPLRLFDKKRHSSKIKLESK